MRERQPGSTRCGSARLSGSRSIQAIVPWKLRESQSRSLAKKSAGRSWVCVVCRSDCLERRLMPTASNPSDRASALMVSDRDMGERLPPGTIKSDVELSRALRRGTAATDSGDAGLPISGFLVEFTAGRPAFGNGRPRFVCTRDMCDETSLRKWHLTCLPRLPFRHTKTARQFSRCARVVHRLCVDLRRSHST